MSTFFTWVAIDATVDKYCERTSASSKKKSKDFCCLFFGRGCGGGGGGGGSLLSLVGEREKWEKEIGVGSQDYVGCLGGVRTGTGLPKFF